MLILLAIQADQPLAPAPANQMRFEVSGLINTPYRLLLDLTSGDAFVDTRANPSVDAAPISKHYRLDPHDLADVRREAALLIASGVDTVECRRPGVPHFPMTMDAFETLSIGLGGKWVAAGPDPSCVTPEAGRFVGHVEDILKRTPTVPD